MTRRTALGSVLTGGAAAAFAAIPIASADAQAIRVRTWVYRPRLRYINWHRRYLSFHLVRRRR